MGHSTDPVSLETLYEYLKWPSDPEDPRALARFQYYRDVLFPSLVEALRVKLPEKRVRILDVLSASGIAGIALASVLARKEKRIELTLVDLRESSLEKAHKWLEKGIIEDIIIETRVSDAIRLPEILQDVEYDIALLWGNSLPHFDTWQLQLVFSGVSELLNPNGCLLVETVDLLSWLLVNNAFQRVLVEGEALSIYQSIDPLKGTVRRVLFRLSDMAPLGLFESRIHDLAGPASMMLPYFEKVRILEASMIPRKAHTGRYILAGCMPRSDRPRWRDLKEGIPYLIESV